jgi:hypothetical protein
MAVDRAGGDSTNTMTATDTATIPAVATRILHYVPRWQALDWIRLGWIIVRRNGHFPNHDQYSITMEWLCDCKMVRPRKD